MRFVIYYIRDIFDDVFAKVLFSYTNTVEEFPWGKKLENVKVICSNLSVIDTSNISPEMTFYYEDCKFLDILDEESAKLYFEIEEEI